MGQVGLPAASTHAGPGLQPLNQQQAAARVLAHFALPSAVSSTAYATAPRPFPSTTTAFQPRPSCLLHPNSPAAAGIHGSPAVFWLQCHHCNLTVMGLPASISLPPADTWTGSSSPVAPPTHTFVAHPIQTPAAVPLPTYPTLPQMAPYSRSIPTILARFATTATSGEFVDFNELLHALESEGTEATPVQIELGEGNRLTLPRKPKKRQVSSFIEWSRCFAVYSHYLSSH